MSSKSSQHPNEKNHGHSMKIKIIVVILLVAAIAWVVAYTRSVERAPIGTNTQSIDPGANKTTR